MKEQILKVLEEGKKYGYNNNAIANELLNLFSVSKRTFRKATPEDIVVGKTVYLLGDDNEIHTRIIKEVLRPDDQWKAFCADDGCRYGLDGLYVC